MRDWPSRHAPQLLHETGPSRILRSVGAGCSKATTRFFWPNPMAWVVFFLFCLVFLSHKTQEQMMKMKKNGEEEESNQKNK